MENADSSGRLFCTDVLHPAKAGCADLNEPNLFRAEQAEKK
jgi:hypothetical protein